MKSFISKKTDNTINWGRTSLLLLFVSLLALFFPQSIFAFVFCILMFFTSIICAINGLSFKGQKHISIISISFVIIIIVFIIYNSPVFNPPSMVIPPGRVFCSDAKSIQLALDKYYYKWHSYPEENKIKKILISEFGKIPKYTRSNVTIVKKYKRISYNNYLITFNTYKYSGIDIKSCKMTPNTHVDDFYNSEKYKKH